MSQDEGIRITDSSARHMAPGGWIEQVEFSIEFKPPGGLFPPDHLLHIWSQTFIDAGEQFGKTFKICDQMKGLIQDAGFEDVREETFMLPVGAWPADKKLKQIGKYCWLFCFQGCEGWAIFLLTRVLKVRLQTSDSWDAQMN